MVSHTRVIRVSSLVIKTKKLIWFETGEEKIPHGLHMLLETMKKQYLAMIQTMQSKQYSDNIIKVNWDLFG